jgi:hypothetical protein
MCELPAVPSVKVNPTMGLAVLWMNLWLRDPNRQQHSTKGNKRRRLIGCRPITDFFTLKPLGLQALIREDVCRMPLRVLSQEGVDSEELDR